VIYMVTTFSLYVPDWSYVYHNDGDVNDGKQFTVSSTFLIILYHTIITEMCPIWHSFCLFVQVKCGVRASLEQACNAVGYVDRQVWGINHLYTQPVWIRSKVQQNSYYLPLSLILLFTQSQLMNTLFYWTSEITLIRIVHQAHPTWVPCELMHQSGALRLLNQKAC
jgi:hypothetical protein